MKWLAVFAPMLICAALAGCSRTVSLSLPSNATVLVHGSSQGSSNQMEPGSPGHAQLSAWLARNQADWSQYMATTPIGGTLVYGPGFKLQVFENVVLLSAPGGVFYKSITPRELALVVQRPPVGNAGAQR